MTDISANETLRALETRRSCRAFKPDTIPDDVLQAILRAGTFAASGMGKQSPLIVAIANKELRDTLSQVNASFFPGAKEGYDPFYGAPVIVLVLANKDVPTYLYDGSLVMGNLMTAAQALGVDSIWIHRAKEEFESNFGKKLLAEWGIEGNYEGIGHCALGYRAAELPAPAARKSDYVRIIR